MLSKTFENFEAKLIKLTEESLEDFKSAENIFQQNYKARLEEIFPRDVLGAKKLITGNFIIEYVNRIHTWANIDTKQIFTESVNHVIWTLPLNFRRKQSLIKNILSLSELSEPLHSYFAAKDDISRDPFFVLVEDFSMDGDISKEEFVLLEQSYQSEKDFITALEVLPENIRALFHAHIELTLNSEHSSKKSEFEWEFSTELQALKDKGINTQAVVVFVSKYYYKTPGKYKKFEHPKRRMRRTFKIALLKLLRTKLGNINAQIMLERFERWEWFEDFFMILFKLLEIVDENPQSEELFSILQLDEELQADVFSAEENKQKILAGESLVMKIANLFSKWNNKNEQKQLDEDLLDKILDVSTDIVWEDIYFNREIQNAWIYADSDRSQQEEDQDEKEKIDYDTLSPHVAYELLQYEFQKLEEAKRQAFLEWNYDDIDRFNDDLLMIESKLTKLCIILWIE